MVRRISWGLVGVLAFLAAAAQASAAGTYRTNTNPPHQILHRDGSTYQVFIPSFPNEPNLAARAADARRDWNTSLSVSTEVSIPTTSNASAAEIKFARSALGTNQPIYHTLECWPSPKRANDNHLQLGPHIVSERESEAGIFLPSHRSCAGSGLRAAYPSRLHGESP